MVKSIFLYLCLLFTISCVHPDIPLDITGGISNPKEVSTPIVVEEPVIVEETYSPYVCLMKTSDSFIGVTEKRGDNQNFTNKELKQMLVGA